jgi:hypothetical protein
MAGFLAFIASNPWRTAAFALAIALILTGIALKIERGVRQSAQAQVVALEAAVKTWAGVVEQRDQVIRQQSEAVAKLKADAGALDKRARAAVAAAKGQAQAAQSEADRLRGRLAEVADTLTCEMGVEEVKQGLGP